VRQSKNPSQNFDSVGPNFDSVNGSHRQSQNFDSVNGSHSVRQSKKPDSFTKKIKNSIFPFLSEKQKEKALVNGMARGLSKKTEELHDKYYGNTGKNILKPQDNGTLSEKLGNYVRKRLAKNIPRSLRDYLRERASRRKGGKKRKGRTRKLKNRT
jgi:hypothetical protein